MSTDHGVACPDFTVTSMPKSERRSESEVLVELRTKKMLYKQANDMSEALQRQLIKISNEYSVYQARAASLDDEICELLTELRECDV